MSDAGTPCAQHNEISPCFACVMVLMSDAVTPCATHNVFSASLRLLAVTEHGSVPPVNPWVCAAYNSPTFGARIARLNAPLQRSHPTGAYSPPAFQVKTMPTVV